MRTVAWLPYAVHAGSKVIKLPYVYGPYEFLIVMPEERTGLAALERELTPALLNEFADAARPAYLALTFPEFQLASPAADLTPALKSLGMKSAFDEPAQSADFTPMASRKERDPIYLSAIYHKVVIEVDERGTTAAAATGTGFGAGSAKPPKPVLIRVDHPFIFAIRDTQTGLCLFLGRVTNLH